MTNDVRQVVERLRRFATRVYAQKAELWPTPERPHLVKHDRANCEDPDHVGCAYVGLVEAARLAADLLTAQPAPSGWQQRIAAMDPWTHDASGESVCCFCDIWRYTLGENQKWHDTAHKPDCLWQNAVDAGQPAKDALPSEASPSSGLSLAELAARQGVKPIRDISELQADVIPEGVDIDAELEAIRHPAPEASPAKPEPDVVCEHGTAMDVHCCNCHGGFLFDSNACVCGPFEDTLRKLLQRAVDGLTQGACFTCGSEPGANIDCAGCSWVRDAQHALKSEASASPTQDPITASGEDPRDGHEPGTLRRIRRVGTIRKGRRVQNENASKLA